MRDTPSNRRVCASRKRKEPGTPRTPDAALAGDAALCERPRPPGGEGQCGAWLGETSDGASRRPPAHREACRQGQAGGWLERGGACWPLERGGARARRAIQTAAR